MALAAGATVVATVGNVAKKAGALNQALAALLPRLDPEDRVLIVDADSRPCASFLDSAVEALEGDDRIGAVGGVFVGEEGGGVLGALQRNEYFRYQRQISRRSDAMVLTGTATLHRVDVLRRLIRERGTAYDASALTEDNEITLAIKSLGLRCVSPVDCVVETEVMTSWSALWHQRLRWQRGALENLQTYGWTRVTAPYLAQQFGMGVGLLAMWLYLVFTAYLGVSGQLGVSPWWTPLAGIFLLERLVTVWHAGWRARALAAPFFVEWAYDLFLQAVMVRATLDVLFRRPQTWHHGAVDIT